jgi:hypothetical protein
MSRWLVAVVTVLALTSPELRAQSDLRGRVFDADSRDGIENLQVKLTPPRQSKAPIRIANTARDGHFLFGKLASGRYMVEVSQGTTLLYRAEVDTTLTSQLDIPLRRK